MATPAVGAAVSQGVVCDCNRDLRYCVYEASGSFARVKFAVASSGAVPKRVGFDGTRPQVVGTDARWKTPAPLAHPLERGARADWQHTPSVPKIKPCVALRGRADGGMRGFWW